MTNLLPLGDRAFLARFADESSARAWAAAARRLLDADPGIEDIVLAYTSVAVIANPDADHLDDLERRLLELEPDPHPPAAVGLLLEIPVLYDGPDLLDAARRLGLDPADLVARHTGTTYHVFAVGFLPGFPYAGYLPDELSGLPRRPSPRARVPAGSVAIAGRQTGIYPAESPGGWQLLGRTPLRVAEPEAGRFTIRAGDRIRLRPIDPEEFRARLGAPLLRPVHIESD